MKISPAGDLLLHQVLPSLSVARVKILFLNGETLGLGSPEVEHRSDYIKGIPNAEDDFVRCEDSHLLSERVMRLYKPTLIVNLALSAKAAVLKTVVQGVVEIPV